MVSREETIDGIAECAREVALAIYAITTPQWLNLDLTMAQLKALFAVTASAPITVGTLAQDLGIHLSAASHVIDRLVQLDLVERNEDQEDRRRTFLRLSAHGNALVEQLRQGKHDRLHGWLAALSDEDLTALYRGLQAFAKAVTVSR